MTSCKVTVEEVPTMPANCRPPFPSLDDVVVEEFEPVPGAAVLLVGAVLGAARRGPLLSS